MMQRLRRYLLATMYSLWGLVLLTSAAYSQAKHNNSVRDSNASTDYFPKRQLDERIASWLGKKLAEASEPPLLADAESRGAFAFRLVRHSSVSPTKFLIIRLEGTLGGVAQLSVKGVTEDGQVRLIKAQRVSAGQLDGLLRLIERSDFWNLPTMEQTTEGPRIRDGASWFLEGVESGKYHLVYRRAPAPGPLMDLSSYLTNDIAGIK